MKSLHNKVAVITGAGSGIGRALSLAFAKQGCHLALVDVNLEGIQQTRHQVAAATPHCSITHYLCDVSDQAQMAALPGLIYQDHGAIDLLFNNAGITINKRFDNGTIHDIERVMGINLWGVLYGCYYFLPYLKLQPEAHIINTSSLAGYFGMPNQSIYCLTKAAVKSLSESLRAELAYDNIHVTSIHPGTISTNILTSATAHSDDQATTAKLARLMQRYGKSPDKLAQKVVHAVLKNRMQVRVGIDSYLGDWLKRLFPRAIHLPFEWGAGKLQATTTTDKGITEKGIAEERIAEKNFIRRRG